MADELRVLRSLAKAMGVHTRYVDGLGKRIVVAPETLVRVCAALGAPVDGPRDAAEALRARRAESTGLLPPVIVAWDGALSPIAMTAAGSLRAEMVSADGDVVRLESAHGQLRAPRTLRLGYHRF